MKSILITNAIEQSKKFILQQIQNAWNAEVKKDKRKVNKSFLEESDHFKIVDSKEKYNALDINFIPEVLFIVPELMWANDDVNEGYDIARELVTNNYKFEFIQVIFLSVLDRSSLANTADTHNISLVEAFPHVCLLDSKVSIKFEYYSDIHYKLIKHLAVSNEGRLQKISHEMNSVKTNILRETRDVDSNRTDLIAKLEELTLFQQWTEKTITDKIVEVKNATTNVKLASVSKTIDNIIDEINLKLSSKNDSKEIIQRQKSNYKVFIIEDDKVYRNYFCEIFSIFYLEVYPCRNEFNISDAEEIIKGMGKTYNIFLLDLLYKDNSGNWLNFNGLDLYRLVKKTNPYAVIRIITSLPRSIVVKMVEVIMNNAEKPNTDQVFTKKYGYEALKDSIFESIEKINYECKEKEKLKNAWSPFPKEGIFKWQGVSNTIHDLMFNKNDEFEKQVNEAKTFFLCYEKNNLNLDTYGWNNGELTNTRQEGDYVSNIKEKLAIIMAHRLIFLSEAIKTNNYKIEYSNYLEIIKSFTNLKSITQNYFTTKLGFSVSRFDKEKNKSNHYLKMKLINLFPHEILFVNEKLKEKHNKYVDKKLVDFNLCLNDFFKEILILEGPTLYEIWNELELDFNPFQSQKKDLDVGDSIDKNKLPTNLTVKNLRDFLESLINNYSSEFIQVIVDNITSYVLEKYPKFEEDFNEPVTNYLINSLLSIEENTYK